jgi:outer membrane protein TolC
LLLAAVPVLTAGPVIAAEAETGDFLQLDEVVKQATERNPAILAAWSRWQSARDLIEVKGALPDPQLSYTYFVENVETRVGPQKHVIGVKQKFPFYGKRALRAEVASRNAEAARFTYESAKLEIIRQAQKAFYELFYISKALEISSSERAILHRFEQIARTKYQTGKGSQQNILKVHVEISQIDEKLLALEDKKKSAIAGINTLLSRPADHPLGKPLQPVFRPFYFIESQLLRMAEKGRPEVKSAAALIDKSAKARLLSKKNYYPDLTVGANYIEVAEGPLPAPDNGQDAFNVMFSINLPIWRSKLAAELSSISQKLKTRRRQYEDILNLIRFQVSDYYSKIQTARETFSLYRDVLQPQAEQSLKSAEAGYIAGSVGFLDLLDAKRVLLKVQFGYWRAYTDYLKHIADMERSVGRELEEHPRKDIRLDIREE